MDSAMFIDGIGRDRAAVSGSERQQEAARGSELELTL